MGKFISIVSIFMVSFLSLGCQSQKQKFDPKNDPFMKTANLSIKALNLLQNQQGSFGFVETSTMDSIVNLNKLALKYAKEVDTKKLDLVQSGMGEMFKKNLLKGLQDFCEGYDKNIPEKFTEGQVLIARFWDWYDVDFRNNKRN